MQTTDLPVQRIRSIDMLRGTVMLIMALDHVRDYMHNTATTADPLNLQTTTPALFFTRWITHFCAPVFVFLSGTSAFLSSRRKSKKEASLFLIKRGLWLVFVEITIITFALSFNPFYNIIFLQVIWVIGCSFILLGLLLYTNIQIIFLIGFILVAGHNVFDLIPPPKDNTANILMSTLFTNAQRVIPLNTSHIILVFYALLPWTGILFLGYAFGSVYKERADMMKTRNKIFWLGVAITALFIVLRFINGYGEPFAWSVQKNGLYTVLSFINTSKYPPSLMYTCMTIGPALLFLSMAETLHNKFSSITSMYGKVPFFYYVCHFYLIHFLCLVFFFISGFGAKDIANPAVPFFFRPPNFGVSLPYVYLIWLFVIVVLYKPCKWFNHYRSTHKKWWLQYL